jgi:hypothetical protein
VPLLQGKTMPSRRMHAAAFPGPLLELSVSLGGKPASKFRVAIASNAYVGELRRQARLSVHRVGTLPSPLEAALLICDLVSGRRAVSSDEERASVGLDACQFSRLSVPPSGAVALRDTFAGVHK